MTTPTIAAPTTAGQPEPSAGPAPESVAASTGASPSSTSSRSSSSASPIGPGRLRLDRRLPHHRRRSTPTRPAWPDPWMLTNYAAVLTSPTFWRRCGNSTITALATTVGVVILGVMAAFVIARYEFRGRDALYSMFTAGLLFPLTVAILPLYLMLRTSACSAPSPASSSRRSPSRCRRRSSSWCRSCGRSPPSSRRRPSSTAPAASGSSGASCCRCRGPASSPSACSPSSAAGTPTCCRCSCSSDAVDLHAAARSAAVLDAVLAGHGGGARVHLARDAARASCSSPSPNAASSAASPGR